MKTLFLTLALASPSAFADIITCKQTEPFITQVYNTDLGKVTITSPTERMRIEKNLKFVIKGTGSFEIRRARTNEVLARLELNHNGSDGMSDTTYPYDAGQGINGPIGCYSSELPAIPRDPQ